MVDFRLEWIKKKSLTFLGETGDHLFQEMLEERDCLVRKVIIHFLDEDFTDDSNLERHCLILYKTYYKKIVEEEELVQLEITPGKSQRWVSVPSGTDEKTGEEKKGTEEPQEETRKDVLVEVPEGEAKADISNNGSKEESSSKSVGYERSDKEDKHEAADVSKTPEKSSVKSEEGKVNEESESNVGEQPLNEDEEDDEGEEEEEEEEEEAQGSGEGISATETVEGEEDEGKRQKTVKKRKSIKSSVRKEKIKLMEKKGRISPTTLVELIPEPEEVKETKPTFEWAKKIIQKVIDAPSIHGHLGPLQEINKECHYVFFLRNCHEAIPRYETHLEAFENMPRKLLVGSFSGQVLYSVGKLVNQIFLPLAETKPEVQTHEDKTFIKKETLDQEHVSTSPFSEEVNSTMLFKVIMTCPSLFKKHSLPSANENSRQYSIHTGNIEDAKPSEVIMEAPQYTKEELTMKCYLTSQIRKLNAILNKLVQHLEEDSLPSMPNIPELDVKNVTTLQVKEDTNIVSQLEQCVAFWEDYILRKIEGCVLKRTLGEGPSAEYEFWSERLTILNAVVEEMNSSTVAKITTLLKEIDSPVVFHFSAVRNDLFQFHLEANNITKFFDILLQHFQALSEAASTAAVREIMYSLMDCIHKLWTLSKYYSNDTKMASLLEKVVWQLCCNVKNKLDITTLFQNPLKEIQNICNQNAEMLNLWKMAYFDTREKIEVTNEGKRWEFDKVMLFRQTEYIAGICRELCRISKVLEEFENIFGLELKSATVDPTKIDGIMRHIMGITASFTDAEFDIFDPKFELSWNQLMQAFDKNIILLEMESVHLLDELFKNLRSCEHSLEVLLKLKNMNTRTCIKKRLASKFDSVLQFFSKEIASVEHTFLTNRSKPELLRNLPPTAGTILWERQMLNKLKTAVLLFETVNELQNSTVKKEVYKQYLNIAKQMKAFEETKFLQWQAKVITAISTTLRTKLIAVTPVIEESEGSICSAGKEASEKDPKSRMKTQKSAKPAAKEEEASVKSECKICPFSPLAMTMKWLLKSRGNQNTITLESVENNNVTEIPMWGCIMENAVLMERGLKFSINLDEKVFDIIAEAEILQNLGFTLSKAIYNFTSKKDFIHDDLEAVQEVVTRYNKILLNISPEEVIFLKSYLMEVENEMQAGVTRLNWNSICVKKWAKDCSYFLKKLALLLGRTQSISQGIQKTLDNILQLDLFGINLDGTSPTVNCENFFIKMEDHQTKAFEVLMKHYYSIGPELIRMESIVLEMDTGMSPYMNYHYSKWESLIFSTIVQTVLKNLENFNDALLGKNALFQVDLNLDVHVLTMKPTPTEVHNAILLTTKKLIEKFRLMPRWMAGTCISCQPARLYNNDLYTFSFYEDIICIEALSSRIKQIQDASKRIIYKTLKYVKRWRKYKQLWVYNKISACQKFSEKYSTLKAYDERFVFLGQLIQEINEMETHFDIYCIRINLKSLLEAIVRHATEWKQLLGHQLASNTQFLVNKLKRTLKKLEEDLQTKVANLESFKYVLTTVATIKKMAINIELKYRAYQECYHTLSLHGIPPSKEIVAEGFEVEQTWNKLHKSALSRMLKLESTKARFAKMTVDEIEEFLNELKVFVKEFEQEGPGSVKDDFDHGLLLMEKYIPRFKELEEKRLSLIHAEMLFDLPLSDYSDYLKCKSDMERMEQLYNLYQQQKLAQEMWAKNLWVNLNPQTLLDGIESFIQEFNNLPTETKNLLIGKAILYSMEHFKDAVPLFVKLKTDALQERHWKELMDKTGKHFDLSADSFTLDNMFSMELHKYQDITEEIIHRAVKEIEIEKQIKAIEVTWNNTEFQLEHFINELTGEEEVILGPVEQIMHILEDSTIKVQTLAANLYVKPFLFTVQELERSLSLIQEVVDIWLVVQNKWLLLSNMFESADIQKYVQESVQPFEDATKKYRQIMANCTKQLNVKTCCCSQERLNELFDLDNELEVCQNHFSQVFISMRDQFPRFFLICDSDLLLILGSKDPTCIQQQIVKMFDNISHIKIHQNLQGNHMATAMVSHEDEELVFQSSIAAIGTQWLKDIIYEMKQTHRYITKKAVYYFGKQQKTRMEWLLEFQGSICMTANKIWWTVEVENTFSILKQGNVNAMKDYLTHLNKQLQELVGKVQCDVDRSLRKKLQNIIIMDIHNRDIIEKFVQQSIVDVQEFEWELQMKFYWDKEDDDVTITQSIGCYTYGHEYRGLTNRPVITPLTDKVYLSIAIALHKKLGTAIIGTTGTGKGETVKDLSKLLGILCIIINCNESMSLKALTHILNGICTCGIWGCFSNFDHLNISTISAISTHMLLIHQACSLGSKTFYIEDREMTVDKKMGIFITINTDTRGNTEIPESIRNLFRPITTLLPDLQVIVTIILFSEGFTQSKVLGKKITAFYQLAQTQLSKCSHYHFGLRALKQTLLLACKQRKTYDVQEEMCVLIEAIRETNINKLIPQDKHIFFDLIKSVFPSYEYKNDLQLEMKELIEAALKSKNYIIIHEQVEKISQLYQITSSRHSALLLGPSGSGKSVITQTLAVMHNFMNTKTHLHIINPKACTVTDLYGKFDPKTKDWQDGIFTSLLRKINNEKEIISYALVFDGEIDDTWIENMSSLIDDNKLITLANGETLKLQHNCILLFEVGRLEYTSPSTVSKLAVVYTDPKIFDYTHYWKSWLESCLFSEQAASLNKYFEQYIHDVLNCIYEVGNHSSSSLRTILPLSKLNMVTQLCFMLEALLPEMCSSEDVLHCCFLLAMYFSLGAPLVENGRQIFDDCIKKVSNMPLIQDTLDRKATMCELPIGQPTLFDYYFDAKNGCWEQWMWLVPPYVHEPQKHISDILVPTVETETIMHILNIIIKIKRPTAFVGESGTLKSCSIHHFMKTLDMDTYMSLTMHLTFKTTSSYVQSLLEDVLEKQTKDRLGPKDGKKLICFIDDINTPQEDDHGSQQPLAFLRSLFETGGFHNPSTYSWKSISDIGFITAMNRNTEERKKLDSRFISRINTFYITFPSYESLMHIYTSVLTFHTEEFNEDVKRTVPFIAEVTIDVYKKVTNEFPSTPQYFHYIFNLHDLMRIYAGLLLTTAKYITSRALFVRTWRNEFCRGIVDKFSDIKHLKLINDYITSVMEMHFIKEKEDILQNPLLFGDFRNTLSTQEPRCYEDLVDYDGVKMLFKEIIEERNAKHGITNTVLSDDILEHLTRVHHVLRMNQQHLLMVGAEGCGKQTIVQLAAFSAGCKIYQVWEHRKSDAENVSHNLKQLFHKSGIQNQPTAFLVKAGNLHEDYFDAISNILVAGMVPLLFSEEEKSLIKSELSCSSATNECDALQEDMWEYFISLCRRNIHVVLCVTPTGEELHSICSRYPAILKKSYFNWMFPWPKQALIDIAEEFILQNADIPEDYQVAIIQHMAHVHSTLPQYNKKLQTMEGRINVICLKHYLDYINTYLELLKDFKQRILTKCRKLEGSISKIAELIDQKNSLSNKLITENLSYCEKESTSESLLVEISTVSSQIEVLENTATTLAENVMAKSEQIETQMLEVSQKIGAASAMLEESRAQLSVINMADVVDSSCLEPPPEALLTVIESVAIIVGCKDISWESLKEMLSESNVLLMLEETNYDCITVNQMKRLKENVQKCSELIALQPISEGGYELFKFVQTVLDYCSVYKDVRSKKEKLAILERQMEQEKKEMENISFHVQKLHGEMTEYKMKYESVLKDKIILQSEMEKTKERLALAQKLTSELHQKQTEWNQEVLKQQLEATNAIGNCLLSSAFLCYLGAFKYHLRQLMLNDNWSMDLQQRDIPFSITLHVEDYLLNLEVNRINNLTSTDRTLIQNTVIISIGKKYPLCIDPQEQAYDWIKQKESKSNLKIITIKEISCMQYLENAINVGYPVILEIDDVLINPLVEGILEKRLDEQNGQLFIELENKMIAYEPNFRLYIITRLPNPKLDSQICSKTTVIDFAITPLSMEEQLLGVAYGIISPSLEITRTKLIEEIGINKNMINAHETEFVENLCFSSRSILDDPSFQQKLEHLNTKVSQGVLKLEELVKQTAAIDATRKEYQPLAKQGTILFFVLLDMAKVNYMYQHALSTYLNIFSDSVRAAPFQSHTSAHLESIINILTEKVMQFGYCGIINKDKITFLFHLRVSLEINDSSVSKDEYHFLLRKPSTPSTTLKESPADWIPRWPDVLQLSEAFPETFRNLPADVHKDLRDWKKWYDLQKPEEQPFPSNYSHKCTPFQKLMLLQCFRTDRLYPAIVDYITFPMRNITYSPPAFSLDSVLEMSATNVSVLLIVTSAVDVVQELTRLACSKNFSTKKIMHLSLGTSIEQSVWNMLDISMKKGCWLLIQNCHLQPYFLSLLHSRITKSTKFHPDFKLWMSTNITSDFPFLLLQKSIKAALEPPKGLKSKLNHLLMELSREQNRAWEYSRWKPVTFGIAFFHAIIQERNKFKQTGWTVSYDFTDMDFNLCIHIMDEYLSKSSSTKSDTPWNMFKYLYGEVVYGGHIINIYDLRTLKTYLNEFLGEFLYDRLQSFYFYKGLLFDIPTSCSNENDCYMEYIASFPALDSSEIFGLPMNIDIKYYSEEINRIQCHLGKLHQSTDLNSKNADQYEVICHRAKDIAAQLPNLYNIDKIKNNFLTKTTPAVTVLIQELERFNVLLECMHSSLHHLLMFLSGKIQMDSSLEEMAASLHNGKLPNMWRKFSPETCKNLGGWLAHLEKRIAQYNYWSVQGEPLVLWLSGLHVPRSYIIAVVQIGSQKNKWAIEDCTFCTKVTHFRHADEVEERPQIGCYIVGLHLESASWDSERHCLATPHYKINSEGFPIIFISPSKIFKRKNHSMLSTPVYVTSSRRDFVFEAELDIKTHESWLQLQGICLILNID